MKLDKEVLFRQSPSEIYFHNISKQDVFLINNFLESKERLSQK